MTYNSGRAGRQSYCLEGISDSICLRRGASRRRTPVPRAARGAGRVYVCARSVVFSYILIRTRTFVSSTFKCRARAVRGPASTYPLGERALHARPLSVRPRGGGTARPPSGFLALSTSLGYKTHICQRSLRKSSALLGRSRRRRHATRARRPAIISPPFRRTLFALASLLVRLILPPPLPLRCCRPAALCPPPPPARPPAPCEEPTRETPRCA